MRATLHVYLACGSSLAVAHRVDLPVALLEPAELVIMLLFQVFQRVLQWDWNLEHCKVLVRLLADLPLRLYLNGSDSHISRETG